MSRGRVGSLVMVGLGLASLGLAAEPSAVWLDLPFVRQAKDGCGAASIAMVMQYWIQEGYFLPPEQAEPERIYAALVSRDRGGAFASDLERYLREHGFKTFAFRGEWDDLRQHLTRGRPLIVCLRPPGRGDRRHFLVVAGLDEERKIVLVNDPSRRKLAKLKRHNFEEEWKAANSWTLLALPAEDR